MSLGKCVLLSTSKSVRKAVKLWDFSGDGRFWKVQLDVRDLGRHLDFTKRAGAGTLSCRISRRLLLVWLLLVPCLQVFQVKLGLVRGKYILAGLHAAGPLMCLPPRLVPLLLQLLGRVWSSKMPLASTPAVLNLLDGPVGVDPALEIVWVRFRMMRRY